MGAAAVSASSTGSSGGGSTSGSGGVGASESSLRSAPKWKGRVLKRFKLIDLLGQGSMGRVFRAEDITLRRHVAVKVLPTKTKDGQRDRQIDQFLREARSAASLEHPNAVAIYEIGEASGVHYIAMELVEGGNLEKLVQMSGPMEVERACQVCAEAAEALGYAHQLGIIHRDVKPSNLLLSRNGRCKLADFGLARLDAPDDPHGTRGECVGTPAYLAPELPLGEKATPQSDIYSLGCTLWFLLTGAPLYGAANKRDMIKMHVHAALPNLRDVRPGVPERLVVAIERACAKNPGNRYAKADQFAKVLRTFTIPTGSSASTPTMRDSAGASGSAPTLGSGSLPAIAMPSTDPSFTPAMSSHASASMSTITMSGVMPQIHQAALSAESPARRSGPLLWAGAGTLAAVALICVGVWIARGGSGAVQSAASSAPPAKPLAVPVVEGPNALVNGAIDPAADGTGVTGWFLHDRFKQQTQFLTEDGNRFVRLTNDDPAKTVFLDQRIHVEPNWRTVTVSARMRASNFKAGANPAHDGRVAFAFRDANDKRVGNWPPVPCVKEDSGWTERVVTADVPAGATSIYIQLAVFNAIGSVDFDDVKVVPRISGANK
jgi:serine/threonine protein kinase